MLLNFLLQGSCGPYIELGKAYTASNSAGVKDIITNRMETFVSVSVCVCVNDFQSVMYFCPINRTAILV